MMKNTLKKEILLSLIVVISGLLLFFQEVSADTLDFQIDSNVSIFQVDRTVTYFDLRLETATSTQIEVGVTNVTDKTITVQPSVKTATTNFNGVVEYGDSLSHSSKTLLYKMENLVTAEKKNYQIPANSRIVIPFMVKMPQKDFNGILAGGITIMQNTKKMTSAGNSTNNRYIFTKAIVLHGQKNINQIDLKLNSVTTGQLNARNVINLNLDNQSAQLLNQVKVSTRITKKNNTKTLYHSQTSEMQMAPNSLFAYPTSLKSQPLKSGIYTMHATVTSKRQKWRFNYDFKITSGQAKKLNAKDITLHSWTDYLWWLLLILLVLLFISGLIIFFTIRIKRKEREMEEELADLQELLKEQQVTKNGEKVH